MLLWKKEYSVATMTACAVCGTATVTGRVNNKTVKLRVTLSE